MQGQLQFGNINKQKRASVKLEKRSPHCQRKAITKLISLISRTTT